MRAKVLLAAFGLAILVLAPAIYLRFAPSSPASEQTAAQTSTDVSAAPVQAPVRAVAPVAPHHMRTAAPVDNGQGVSVPDSDATDHQEYVQERCAELTSLGASSDPQDLKSILFELNNKEPDIRKAALDAAVQFGSKDAIPALQNQMSWAEDPEEKVAIKQAIDYLNLPSFGQFIASGSAPATQSGN